MAELAQNPDLRERLRGVCLALMESEIDLAMSLLRLAEVETNGGNDAQARELIARACAMHKVALNYLDGLPVGQEKHEFDLGMRRLFEAIRAAERLRRKADQ
jgi:hypothetical protein